MSDIQWTDETWNPTTGCTKVSPGCAKCYIERTPPMRMAGRKFVGGKIPMELHPERLDKPLSWKKPRRIFVNSMSDLFHEDVPDEFIDRVFATMALCSLHTFQVLTKRAERMANYFAFYRAGQVWREAWSRCREMGVTERGGEPWPLPNVWLGVSCEDQKRADERIPFLLKTPAAVRFLSVEPLLGAVDLSEWLFCARCRGPHKCGPGAYETPLDNAAGGCWFRECRCSQIGWVIVGGESGPDARPCRPEWIRSIIQQCKSASIPAFVKQLGGNIVTRNDMTEDAFNGKDGWHDPDVEHDIHGFREEFQGADCRVKLRDKKGGDPEEWPADLRVREFPK
jgi:protein gp37